MAINKELLAKVRDLILEEPCRYNQEAIGIKSTESPCGTAGCIYGWGAVLGGLTTMEELRTVGYREVYQLFDMDDVSRMFGLSIDQGDVVMSEDGSRWPAEFCEALRAAQDMGDKEGEAKAAAAYLDYIIETGEVE